MDILNNGTINKVMIQIVNDCWNSKTVISHGRYYKCAQFLRSLYPEYFQFTKSPYMINTGIVQNSHFDYFRSYFSINFNPYDCDDCIRGSSYCEKRMIRIIKRITKSRHGKYIDVDGQKMLHIAHKRKFYITWK